MAAVQADRASSLLERLARRVGVYVEGDKLRRSRVDGILATVGLDDASRRELERQLVVALAAVGILLVDDVSTAAVPLPSQRSTDSTSAADPADPVVIDLDQARTMAMRVLADRDRSSGSSGRLLSGIEEVGLAVLMRGDRYDLTADLPENFRASLDARSIEARAFDAFVLMNTRLVWSIARKHTGDVRSDLELEDVVGYGLTGLIRAVRKFDAGRGFKFSTYATNWIEQSMQRGIMDFGRSIRLPVHLQEKMQRTRKAYAALQLRGLTPTPLRLAAETGFEVGEIVKHLQYMQGVVSLDLAVGEDGSAFLGQFVAMDSVGPDPVTELLDQDRRRIIDDLLVRALKGREAAVLRYRFGFGTDEPMTLDEIGRVFLVTRERIRQIESKALGKLQTPGNLAILRG